MSIQRPALAAYARDRCLLAAQEVTALLRRRRLQAGRSALTDEVCAALRTEGVYVACVERLLGPAAPACRQAMAVAAALVAGRAPGKRPRWHRSEASIDLAHEELLARLPALFLFGLDATMLAIAEQYLRVPVAYHGAVLRHSRVDGRQVGPRRWHRDAEDFHVLRTVLYLNDVDEDGGPFEYVPRALRAAAERAVAWDGMCTDDEMAQRVPRDSWWRCTGPAGTVVIADSAQVFHHESLQRGCARSVLMMGHSSRHPWHPALAQAHFPAHRHAAALAGVVPPPLLPHVFDWRVPGPSMPEPSAPATTIVGDFIAG